MGQTHVTAVMRELGCVGGLKFGIATGLLVDGDLTSVDTAKANVETRGAVRHVSQALFADRVEASLDAADAIQSGYTSGGVANAMNSRVPDESEGFMLVY
ncbi:MAG: hypothetical protein ACRD43_05205 [Pyrinomonadaceae bacterium]